MVSPETDIASFDGFQQNHTPTEHRPPPRFPTFDELLEVDDVGDLHDPLFLLLEKGLRYNDQELAEAEIGFRSMTDAFRGKKRKHQPEKDAATHMALVAMMDAHAHLTFAGQRLPVDQLVLDFHHDDIEDLGGDQTTVERRLTDPGDPADRAAGIALGVELLTRYDTDHQGYLLRIRANDTVGNLTPLRIKERKLADTTHGAESFRDELRRGLVTPETVERHRNRKIIPGLAILGEDNSPNTRLLNSSLIRINDDLAIHFQRAQVARRSTVRVPA